MARGLSTKGRVAEALARGADLSVPSNRAARISPRGPWGSSPGLPVFNLCERQTFRKRCAREGGVDRFDVW